MPGERIVVGFDGSVASRQALTWAVREAARRRGRVLVVRAWELSDRVGDATALRTERIVLDEQMREAIRLAHLDLALRPVSRRSIPAPVIGRELIIADPITALCHAARTADVVVVGAGPVVPAVLAWRLARRRHRFGGPCPLIVVVPGEPLPAEKTPELLAAVA
jgi:nucleotide-binding universal stress UspA family protein